MADLVNFPPADSSAETKTADADQAAPALPFNADLWTAAIREAREDAKELAKKGRDNVEAYLGYDTLDRPAGAEFVCPPNDYMFTSQKVALLFYKTPEVHLHAEQESSRMAAPLFAAVLNQRILPKAHVQELMERMVTDVILPAGIGACKIGYEGFTEDYQEPVIDPLTQQPVPEVDPMSGLPTGQPQMQTKTRTISEHFPADRIPPGRLLFDVNFLGGNFHDAPWLGYDFYENVPEGETGGVNAEDEEQLLQVGRRRKTRRGLKNKKRRITQVWYKAHPVDPTAHPDEIRYFELVEKESEPRKHERSPYQMKRQDGTMGGWNKYPILVLQTRVLPDTAVPPSDADITRNIFDELSRSRTDLMLSRKRNVPQVGYDATKVTADTKKAIEQNVNSARIPFNGPVTEDTYRQLAKGTISPDDYSFNQIVERDGRGAWSMPESTTGLTSQGGAKTATEIQRVEVNAATRLDFERERVLKFFCDDLVAGLASFCQQFAAKFDDIELNGPAIDPNTQQPIPTGETRYLQWDRARIQGNFTYTVQAGAALRHDADAEWQKTRELYTISRQDPAVNPGELSRMLFEAAGKNWEKVRQQPPPPRPEPKDVLGLIRSPEIDLNPLSPHYPNILQLLAWGGAPVQAMLPPGVIMLDPMTGLPLTATLPAQVGDSTHKGTQPEAEPIDKHKADLTGELPGGGSIVNSPLPTGRIQ